jgi:tetratricopeptide (TPR) repeat protein
LHFLLGWALYVEGDFLSAREELEWALELDSSMLEARMILTRNYAALGKHDLAVEEGRGVLRRRPEDHDLRRVVARSLAIQGQLDAALAELDRIPEIERDTRMLITYGRLQAAKGDHARARSFYEQALATSPNNPGILNLLLVMDRRDGRLEESVARIGAALESEPGNDELVQLQGTVARITGRLDEAEARFREAIELNPGNAMPYLSLARLLQSSGRGDEALWTYEKAVAKRPDMASLHLIVATLYELRGGTERAIWHYEEAIGLDDRLVAAKNDLANLLAETRRDLDRAHRLAQEARSAMPDNPYVADTIGWVLFRMDMISAAIGYLEEAVALSAGDPDAGVIRYHLARAYAENLQERKARKTIQRALAELESGTDGTGQPEPEWATRMRELERTLGRKIAVPWSKKRGRGQRR